MIQTDSHLHTSFSSDSTASMEEMIQGAIKLGLTSICFTDHYDMDFPVYEEGLDFSLDTDAYLQEFCRLKSIYEKQIELRIGVELGILPSLKEKLSSYLDTYGDKFDFVIGSTHIVDGFDPYHPSYFGQYEDERDGIRRYFEANLSNLHTFHGMDSFGHFDYVVRYAPHKDDYYIPSDYYDIADAFFEKIIREGIALEFNTAGLKYGMKQANPHLDLLKRYRQKGGELITIGSDGHKPEHIAWDFQKGVQFLTEAGFSYYTVYKKRKPQMLRLS